MASSTQTDSFAARLALALKALNLSRAHLAAAVGVDKSVASRWLSGQATPTSINLARISEMIGKTRAGFNVIAWDLPLAEFEALLGVSGSPIKPAPQPEGLHPPDPKLAANLSVAAHSFQTATDAARRETGRYGDAYDGLWEVFRPAYANPGKFIRDQGIIHRRDGLLHMRLGGQGFECTGWVMMLQSQLYTILSDRRDDTLVFSILNGVKMPRVESTNGLMMAVTSDRFQTPTASQVLWRRVEDLTGNDVVDRARFEERKNTIANQIDASEVDDAVRELFRRPDMSGPVAQSAGGELLLRALFDPAISFGAPAKLVTRQA